jgi:CRISPR-associated protein Csm4
MQLFRSTFKLASASASPWQADTLFGHLCWSLVRREGEEFLTDLFLPQYRDGQPPVLMSDGFPAGYLPRPRGPAFGPGEEGSSKPARVQRYREVKDHLKAEWLTVEEFNRVCCGEFFPPGKQPTAEERITTKNCIDRLTNTAGGAAGGLFEFMELCLPAIDVYWRIADDHVSLVREFLEDLQRTGYGKRRSVGYGQVVSYSLDPVERFPDVEGANGFVTLSSFVPARADPTTGFWTTKVKYGKLGEEAALGPQPFKSPLIRLGPGSCFYDSTPREWYGRLVANIAADRRVVQYGYAFPVRLCLPSGQED